MTRRPKLKPRAARQTVPRACLLLWVILGLAWGARGALAQSKSPPDYEVKAAFLINFPKYVEWFADASAETNGPIIIACLGENKVSEALRKVIQSRPPTGRPIVAKVIATEAESAGCHILFVSDAERRRLPAILEKLRGANVLTVGESDDFLAKGGIINLALRDRKVRVEVNLDAARSANLKISSKLLGVADVVKGKAN
jgi:hypothetical protein